MSVIRSSWCQCPGQVGFEEDARSRRPLVMILAVRSERVTRRLKGRLPAAEHAPGAVRWWAVITVSARITALCAVTIPPRIAIVMVDRRPGQRPAADVEADRGKRPRS